MDEWNAETAEWYADKYGEYATNRLGVAELELGSEPVVVDVGCGTGAALRAVVDRAPRATLIGVDPVPRMIEIARERAVAHASAEKIQFREGSAEALPVDDGIADVVLAFDSFDHWSDKARGLAEVRRVLRQSGRFVVVKDAGAPGGERARREFADALGEAGLAICQEHTLAEGDVQATMWTCRLTP